MTFNTNETVGSVKEPKGKLIYETYLEPIYIERKLDTGKMVYKYRCSVVKRDRLMSLHGRVVLPNGNVDVNIAEYQLSTYSLKVEVIDMDVNSPTYNRSSCIKPQEFLIGTNRQTVFKAWKLLNATQPSFAHIEDTLTDAGYPCIEEFNSTMKSPIKHHAKRDHKVPGVLVNDKSTVIVDAKEIG
jgi:hypothetical protein